jgi:Secretion system C-terminal sorting domain/SprB repeat
MTTPQPSTRLSIFALIAVCILLLANSNNPPNGRTGAPGDNGTCAGCHTGNNPGGFNGSIVIDNFPSTIMSGNTYNLSARVVNPNGLASRGGFQAVVLNESAGNSNAGNITVSGTNPSTILSGGRKYVEHNPAIDFPPNNEITWNFNWMAPDAAPGNIIKFYAAAVIGNGGASTGDLVVTFVASGTIANMVDPLEVTVDVTDVLCAGECNGTATATIEGGTPPYILNWSPIGGNAAMLTDLCPGHYSLEATDNNNTTTIVDFTIGEPDPLLAFFTSTTDETTAGANNGSATASATGGTSPFAYLWSNGATTTSINNLAPGNYCITVTDANNCTATTCTEINAGDCNLAASFSYSDVSCFGACDGVIFVITTGGTGAVNYFWSNGATIPLLTNLCSGNYTLIATDAANCSITLTVGIATPDEIVANTVITSESAEGAMNGAIQLNASGGVGNFSYNWSNGATTANISNLAAGNYCVTITDGVQCQEVYCYEVPLIICEDIVINTNVIENNCPNECAASIEASLSGGSGVYTFAWSNGATTANINNLCDGSYTLLVSDDFGCQFSDTIVLYSGELMINESTYSDAGCFGACDGSISVMTIAGTGPFSYDWNEDAFDGMNAVSNVCAGFYELTVTDGNGCTELLCFDIDEFDELLVSTIGSMVCFGECKGTVSIFISGGNPPYSFNSNSPLEDICPGEYQITVTDSEGCSALNMFSILEYPEIEYMLVDINDETNGQGNGSILLNVSGGTGPFSFVWSVNGNIVSTLEDPVGLSAGVYTLIITDVVDCSILAENIVIGNLVGTSEQYVAGSLSLFPNPASESVYILLGKTLHSTARLHIYDIRGQQVSEMPVVPSGGSSFEISIADLAPGVYILLLKDGDQIWRERLLKQ